MKWQLSHTHQCPLVKSEGARLTVELSLRSKVLGSNSHIPAFLKMPVTFSKIECCWPPLTLLSLSWITLLFPSIFSSPSCRSSALILYKTSSNNLYLYIYWRLTEESKKEFTWKQWNFKFSVMFLVDEIMVQQISTSYRHRLIHQIFISPPHWELAMSPDLLQPMQAKAWNVFVKRDLILVILLLPKAKCAPSTLLVPKEWDHVS